MRKHLWKCMVTMSLNVSDDVIQQLRDKSSLFIDSDDLSQMTLPNIKFLEYLAWWAYKHIYSYEQSIKLCMTVTQGKESLPIVENVVYKMFNKLGRSESNGYCSCCGYSEGHDDECIWKGCEE